MPQKKFGYKQGDRVQHTETGVFGTVTENQTTFNLVKVDWEDHPGIPQRTPVNYVQIAPWHGLLHPGYVPVLHIDVDSLFADFSAAEFTEAGSLGGAVKAAPVGGRKYTAGDRVKLKFARKCGTVRGYHVERDVVVEWDHSGIATCPEKDLVTLWAPRDTDPVNPNQKAIDEIEALRVPLKQEIEALQAKLSALTQAKKLLERG